MSLAASDARQPSADVLAALLAADGDIVVFTDADDRIEWVSPAIVDVLGWEPDEYRSIAWQLVHPDDRAMSAARASAIRSATGFHPAGTLRHLAADGSWRWLEATAVNMLDDHAVVVTRYRDVTEQVRRAETIATTDELTGLPVRGALDAALTERLEKGGIRPVAVLFLDLDGFKAVNDRFGHTAGDQVLREVARRLGTRVRDSEVLCRWGGDEFVAVLDVAGPTGAVTVATRLRAAIVDRPFAIDGTADPSTPSGLVEVSLGVSVGIAIGRSGDAAQTLIAAADRAMYRAKRGGTGVVTADKAA